MAKALFGHVGGPDPRMVSEMRRLQQRVRDLEAELVRLQEENESLRLRLATRTCWCRIASPRTSDERWQDAATNNSGRKPRLNKLGNGSGAPVAAPLFVACLPVARQ